MSVRRYLHLFWIQLRTSALLALQYRWDFLVDGAISLFWTASALVPLFVIYQSRPAVAGWTFPEALLVVGWFTLLEAILEGAINPSLTSVVDHIRKGTLDFVLIKPADAQFLVSTARLLPWRATNVLTAGAIFVYAFHRLGHGPTLGGVLAASVLFVAAVFILYSLWILTVSAAFYVVRIDNLTFLFTSIFDAARWPASVFRGGVRLVFTFVIPLALLTTYPARALLGRTDPTTLLLPLGMALVFGVVSRGVWRRALGRYTSASS